MRRRWSVPYHRVRQAVGRSTERSCRSWRGTSSSVVSSSQRSVTVIVVRRPGRFPWRQVGPFPPAVRALVTYGHSDGLEGEVATRAMPRRRCHLGPRCLISHRRGASAALRRRVRLAGCLSRCRLALRFHFLPTSVHLVIGQQPGECSEGHHHVALCHWLVPAFGHHGCTGPVSGFSGAHECFAPWGANLWACAFAT
jgi:hypothetical protein